MGLTPDDCDDNPLMVADLVIYNNSHTHAIEYHVLSSIVPILHLGEQGERNVELVVTSRG